MPSGPREPSPGWTSAPTRPSQVCLCRAQPGQPSGQPCSKAPALRTPCPHFETRGGGGDAQVPASWVCPSLTGHSSPQAKWLRVLASVFGFRHFISGRVTPVVWSRAQFPLLSLEITVATSRSVPRVKEITHGECCWLGLESELSQCPLRQHHKSYPGCCFCPLASQLPARLRTS